MFAGCPTPRFRRPKNKIRGVDSHPTLYHSGPRDSSGRQGVAIALPEQANCALLAWEPVNDRMAYVQLKGHFTNMYIVSVYALTSSAEQQDKENVYSQLEELVERPPRYDLLIVAGNWNGRTGTGGPSNGPLIGLFELDSRSDNGERMLQFAKQNRLFVTNTCFQHHHENLLTWYLNDRSDRLHYIWSTASQLGSR
ncbi:unnamed protein product [Dibothriocephalus latus]|uniref:Endonuclease/exonuclease/phosphatase domain-containing protein n=1 Tax=Dibothriocephalus latus TaxID=60516 RepID=A0A3P7NV16_DIBLA|nr:unnamed protein product [Dibothriocephalus latus]